MFGFDLAAPHVPDPPEGDTVPRAVVLTPAAVNQLRDTLVQADEVERTAFVRCVPSGDRLLVTAVDPVPDDQMVRQGRTECRPELSVERRAIHEIIDTEGVVCHVHSHPFADVAGFSSADREIMPKLTRWVEQTYGEATQILFGVLGRESLRLTRYNRETETFTSVPVSVLGGWALDRPLQGATPFAARHPATCDDEAVAIDSRFDRNLRAFGAPGQRRLRDTDVTIVGVGGLGSSVAEQLARVGVGSLHLIDPDHLEESNVPRVYGSYDADIGVPKVEAVRIHLSRIDPELTVTTHQTVVEDEAVAETLRHTDIVIAGLDQMTSRGFLNQFCVRHGLPYIDAGVVIETADDDAGGEPRDVTAMHGFVQSVIPGTTACFDCLNRIDPQQTRIERLPDGDVDAEREAGYVDAGALTPEPAVVTLNTTVAGMAVSELVAFVTGVRPPRGFVHYDGLAASISLLDGDHSRSSDCHTCGRDSLLFQGTAPNPAADDLADEIDTDLSSIPTPAPPAATAKGAGDSQADGIDTVSCGGDDAVDAARGEPADGRSDHDCDASERHTEPTDDRWPFGGMFSWIR